MIPRSNLSFGTLAVAATAALGLAIAALVALFGAGMLGPPSISGVNRPTTSTPAPTPSPLATSTALAATPAPSPTVAASPTPAVELAIASVDRQPSQGGLIVVVDVINHQQQALTFSFDPSYDVHLADATGKAWPLRWAEYKGNTSVPPAASVQLARAFFAGNVAASGGWPLVVSVRRVPLVPGVEWKIDQSGESTLAAIDPTPVLPTPVPSGPVALTLASAQPSTEQGGVQVDLELANHQTNDLAFVFDPNAQVSATDNLGRPYRVAWAQYDGTVRVPAGTSARLARVFFTGPIADGNPAWLTVTVHQVPGARPISAVVGLT
jgi:hypothetical protein